MECLFFMGTIRKIKKSDLDLVPPKCLAGIIRLLEEEKIGKEIARGAIIADIWFHSQGLEHKVKK